MAGAGGDLDTLMCQNSLSPRGEQMEVDGSVGDGQAGGGERVETRITMYNEKRLYLKKNSTSKKRKKSLSLDILKQYKYMKKSRKCSCDH